MNRFKVRVISIIFTVAILSDRFYLVTDKIRRKGHYFVNSGQESRQVTLSTFLYACQVFRYIVQKCMYQFSNLTPLGQVVKL